MGERKNALSFASPSPIKSLAPWKFISTAESNVVRLLYDSCLAAREQANHRDLGRVYISGEVATIEFEPLRYADGVPVTAGMWRDSLSATLACYSRPAHVTYADGKLKIAGLKSAAVEDFLRSYLAVPFRAAQPRSSGDVDSHPGTSGRFSLAAAAGGSVALKANPHHPRRPVIDLFRITHITEPDALRDGFAHGRFDVIVVAGDEMSIFDGTDPRLRGGTIWQGRSNSISALSAKPDGALADDSLRRAIAAALPREEFAARFLTMAGQPTSGFTPVARRSPQRVHDPGLDAGYSRLDLTFIVPPSERTVSRANWLSRVIRERTGISLAVTVPSWPEYSAAISDPQAGDLLWLGISVDLDTPRQWVEDCLFGPWLPLPERYSGLRRRVQAADATDADLIEAERALLAEGWIMPLYHHYHTYLVREELRGMRLDPADWPIPGIHYAEDLSWA